MASQTKKIRQSLLRAQEIRELIRDARGAFAPDHVARVLRHRYMEPYEEDAEEIAGLLGELIDTARRRIEENGIEPLHDEKRQPPKLPNRERKSVAHLTVLMIARSAALLFAGHQEQALTEALEGVAWGRAARDHEGMALGWIALNIIYERMGRWDDQRGILMHAIEEARKSGLPRILADALMPFISYLIESVELDEAERLNLELQSILQNDIPEENRHPQYAASLMYGARIDRYRRREAESIQGFREALRWASKEEFPLTRCSILSHLGSTYNSLEQHRQCIECQHEMVEIADIVGVSKIKSWAYLNLAEAHQRLNEHEQAMELLDLAERFAAGSSWDNISLILLKRAKSLVACNRSNEAAEMCRRIVESKSGLFRPRRRYGALCTLGEIEEKNSRYESAERYYREGVGIAVEDSPGLLSVAHLGLANVLYMQGRHDEAVAMIDLSSIDEEGRPANAARAYRLHAAIAETQSDLRIVIDCERKAAALEQKLLEDKAEQSLRNARIMLQTDLLEREAELERERRRSLERELANAVVAIGDHKRQAAAIEKRLRQVLAQSTSNSQRAVTAALQEALLAFRMEQQEKESVHHYLSKVDEDFQQRLRQRYPELTRKQERLCGLIRTGLDSKEIASLLSLQPEGLKALRKRLRRQLGLEQEETLEGILAEI